jgi:hypothetical protein
MGVSPITPAAADILVMCDRALGEIGRRSHLFSWLRPPGYGPEDWLSVDAYYPGNRLVVLWREKSAAHAQLYAELVPAHGLRLLALAPGDIPEDPEEAETELRRRIAELQLAPRPAPPDPDQRAPARDTAMARVAASLAQATTPSAFEHRPPGAARTAAGHTTRPPAARRSSEPAQLKQAAVGLLLGVVLATALTLELYFGFARLALGGGHVLLAFGIAMDAVARTLGTVAAGRAGRPGRAWACALGGSVAVAPFALFGRDGPVSTDPAPLAGLLSVLALSAIALAVLGSAVGI